MDFTVRDRGNHKIFELSGSLDIYSASKTKKDINQVIEDTEPKSVILDMSKVTHIDSSGIALLANLQKKMKTEEGKFGLLKVTGEIMAVLRLSSLDNFFSLYAAEEDLK
jgi:anti-anti-sigma factor